MVERRTGDDDRARHGTDRRAGGAVWLRDDNGATARFDHAVVATHADQALGLLEDARVPDASGLFNLMRTLGGAIGIALIDTVLYGRAPVLGDRLLEQMKGGSVDAAGFVGINIDDFAALSQGSMDIDALGELQDKVEKAALAMAVNEAWLMLAGITLIAILALLATRRPRP